MDSGKLGAFQNHEGEGGTNVLVDIDIIEAHLKIT
jgi:hypothetical protein